MNKSVIERRRFNRVRVRLPIELKKSYIDGQRQKGLSLEIVDISEGGLRLISDKPLVSSMRLYINLPPRCYEALTIAKRVEVQAGVIWSCPIAKTDKFFYGLSYLKVKPGGESLLRKLVKYEIELLEQIERVPHNISLNYAKDFVTKRREWLSKKTNVKFSHISYFSAEPEEFRGNIENFIGVAHVPIGLVGPLLVRGDFANGIFYVPFATTEGALVETYQRGAIALTKAGGVKVFINRDENHLDPIFLFRCSDEARRFISWINNNFVKIKEKAESTTGFGRLLRITPYLIGRRVILDFAYYTGDAMGANMINIATEQVCKFISKEIEVEKYLLRSNFSSEKKASAFNLLVGYGKEVSVEALVPREITKKYLFTSPEEIHRSWHSWAVGSFSSGMLGINAHYANGLAAIFIACGQDVAHIPNASVGITLYEITEFGDLYLSLKLPNIIVGTVGGGTALNTQRECLEMIGCYGEGKAKKFAEIIGASLLAGEVGICAGLTSEYFLEPHKRSRIHTREKAFRQKD